MRASLGAALYARVSTYDQRAEMQIHELRQLAEQRGWSLVGEHVDEGISGARERRPAHGRRRRGKLHVVAVWWFDRFAGACTGRRGRAGAAPERGPPRAVGTP